MWQPRDGYRFSVDPLLLIDFVRPPFARAVDLGCGVGVVGLGLLTRDAAATVTLVELQPRLAELTRRNVGENAMEARATVVEGDVAAGLALPGASADLVTCNPPYRTVEEGPPSPDPEAAIAQHELRLTLPAMAAEMRRLLVPGGCAVVVFPSARTPALLAALEAAALRPQRARFVHPRADEAANRVLVEAVKGAKGSLVVEPPLILRDAKGYTDEAARLLGDR